jgi:hypothetical protein
MAPFDVNRALTDALLAWEGVETRPHRFGGVEFRVGNREIGHLHPGGVADLLLSVRLRRDLVAAGRAEPHHWLPNTGWITVRLRSEHDLPNVLELFRLNYDRLRGVASRPTTGIIHASAVMLGDRTTDDLPA